MNDELWCLLLSFVFRAFHVRIHLPKPNNPNSSEKYNVTGKLLDLLDSNERVTKQLYSLGVDCQRVRECVCVVAVVVEGEEESGRWMTPHISFHEAVSTSGVI